jgi:hypothetical protein
MKRNALRFGLIIGTILTLWMLYSAGRCYVNPEHESNDTIGYAAMVATFSFIFVGIKNYRDKQNGGVITFGHAFKLGFYISLIAATMYVVVWLIDYYIFIPDFLNSYGEHVLYQASLNGATQPELDHKVAEIESFKDLYKNPVFVVVITYAEVLPIGIVVSAISALILKRSAK